MDDQVRPEVVAERYGRLVTLVEEIALTENQALAGSEVEVMVADGEGRKDGATHRMSGRAKDNRLVHFTPASGDVPRPGDLVTTVVSAAAPHYLIADNPPLAVRRTRGGDAWQASAAGEAADAAAKEPVLLGIPALPGRP
jgi:tRNA-2-methylthio-N6-dimethylallyladenosine synthase